MTTTFFLIRHAAHDHVGDYLAGRIAGIRLGETGKAQALRLARRMASEPIAAVFCSPRERTQETADPVAALCGTGTCIVCEELDEIDFGVWSGRTFEELSRDAAWRRWNDHRQEAMTPSGETMLDVQRRIGSLIERLRKRHQNKAIALVSHADVIKGAVCGVLGLSPGDCFRFDIDPASITTIVSGDWGSKLIRLNEAA
ncbi:histidine phosphatase family protein [Mesorhizobium sp. M0051]|uniref:histidine phosphatase family protein n=1 Tax=unclassified Mesorhizobium TaxID=325217 RepID=UPI00333946C5